ncbi:B- and T-lymphocyte attenuator-like isoform X2 [Paramisgurnus dabryanus]|uniref:B- and T-lymphocyte attenuator-like isoform X2 n=1 Tax=Paramisgurnus dabryanus TaxID=90735 RepID=UPI0031F38A5F
MDNCFLQFICNLVACLVLLSLLVSGNTNESELGCITSIKVPRNKLVKALVMTVFKINCSVNILKCQGIPKMSWCKLYGEDCKALNQSNYTETVEWKNITYGIAFLTFLNISMEDAGLYRCKNQNSVSHSINVTVSDRVDSDSCNESNTILGNTNVESLQWLLPYLYICGGVMGLVVIVIAVSLFIIRCKGKGSTRNVMTVKNQCIETQRRDLTTTSHPHHNTPPPSAQLTTAVSCANDTLPVRAGSHRDRTSAGRVSANTIVSKGCRNNVRTQEEEEDNPLVYASLNHQAMSRGPKPTVQQETEPSEYAAIRFR